MLGHRRLTRAGVVLKLADRPLPRLQRLDQPEPQRVTKALDDFGGPGEYVAPNHDVCCVIVWMVHEVGNSREVLAGRRRAADPPNVAKNNISAYNNMQL